MRKKPTRKRPYFKMESAMTAILRDASGKMHHGILFDPPLVKDCIRKLKPLVTLYMSGTYLIIQQRNWGVGVECRHFVGGSKSRQLK